jgi:ABC-2 type transport system ATP-binding protein
MLDNQLPLRVTHLYKAFGQNGLCGGGNKPPFVAVDHISFELKLGEILGLLGSNGAGKTTTIQMLLGTMIPTSGSITYFGQDLSAHRSSILQKVSFASTYIRLPGRLSVYENLDFYAKLYHLSSSERAQRIEELLKFFDLWRLKDRKAGALSAGETTRAILAKAFIPKPRIVLLDEPTASLDPDIAHEVRHFVLQQRKEHNVSILFTSHNMDEVAEVCDRVLVLQQGKIIAHDTPASLAASVSKVKVHLVSEQLPMIREYAHRQGIISKGEDREITFELDDHEIANFLAGITKEQMSYTHISIEKPTLEDYFLQIAQQRKGAQ